MKYLICVCICIGGILLPSGGEARAALMAYEFVGVINSVDDPSGLLDGSIVTGSEYSGQFTYDSTAVDVNPRSSEGEYTGPLFSMTLTVGTYSWYSGNGNGIIYISDSSGGEDALSINTDSFLIDEGLVTSLGGGLIDNTGNMFSSDALPLSLPPLIVLENWFHAKGDNGLRVFSIGGTFTGFNIVPEPSGLLFFATTVLWGFIRPRPMNPH